jgi:DNA-binding PadR family transcriptional regulator
MLAEMPRDELLTGEWAVLALLREGPAHGYAVAGALAPDGEIGRVWSLNQPLTYRALDVLKERGLIAVTGERPGEGGPRRIELEATDEGRELVERWLATPEEHIRDLRSVLLLKLTFRERAGLELAPLLDAQREVVAPKAAALQARAREGDVADLWRATMAEAALRFIDQALSRPSPAADRSRRTTP